jgi:peptidyl-prolyl cis-trans isomerase A (cyclophilin A)/peptidyl-prolyl cis-trans isomerase B (cyclophilin B)
MSLTRRTLAVLGLVTALGAALPAHAAADPKVKFVTSEGNFTIELYPAKAPKTVENFLQYVKDKQYDGTLFHRVIKGFMIQGGGVDKDYKEKPTRAPIKNEADNGLKNTAGMVAMARKPDPDSASAQFFINVVDNDFLNFQSPTPQGWGYAVFGKVVEGMDTVEKIRNTPTGPNDVPQKQVVIESARLVN